MNSETFLENLENINWWNDRSIVNVVSSGYPLLFFSCIQERFRAKSYPCFQAIDLEAGCYKTISAQLSASFLGTRFVYWLRNFTDLEAKRRSYWISFIEQYKGPHCLVFFSDKCICKAVNDHVVLVDIPESFDLVAAEIFLKSMKGKLQETSILLRSLFKGRKKISLDTLLLFVRYMEVAGPDLERVLAQWTDLILTPESSLFDLSKYLFAGNEAAFFKLWVAHGPQYPAIFWISYWSDIMWRAYHFIRSLESGQNDQAKKIGSRLPFTFLQGGWRQIRCDNLKSALEFLYSLDSFVKSGASNDVYLELFYLKFFTNRWSR